MRRALGRAELGRIQRAVEAEHRRAAASAAAAETRETRAAMTPSELLSGWESVPEGEWKAMEVLGCYASMHLAEVGTEDPQLKTAVNRVKYSSILYKLFEELGEGESPREYIEWAVKEVLRGAGKQWPQDGVPSVYVLVYNWILLKRWRVSRVRRGKAGPRRGKQWEEG